MRKGRFSATPRDERPEASLPDYHPNHRNLQSKSVKKLAASIRHTIRRLLSPRTLELSNVPEPKSLTRLQLQSSALNIAEVADAPMPLSARDQDAVNAFSCRLCTLIVPPMIPSWMRKYKRRSFACADLLDDATRQFLSRWWSYGPISPRLNGTYDQS